MDNKYAIVGLLIAALIGWTIVDGIQQGERGGRIYPDNTPPIWPHHWNLPAVKGYQNSEPTMFINRQISIFCQPTYSPTQMFSWNFCIW